MVPENEPSQILKSTFERMGKQFNHVSRQFGYMEHYVIYFNARRAESQSWNSIAGYQSNVGALTRLTDIAAPSLAVHFLQLCAAMRDYYVFHKVMRVDSIDPAKFFGFINTSNPKWILVSDIQAVLVTILNRESDAITGLKMVVMYVYGDRLSRQDGDNPFMKALLKELRQ